MRLEESKTAHSPLRLAPEDDPWYLPSGPAWRLRQRAHLWRPPTDAYETDASYVVLVEMAGMRGSDFSITFEKQVLWIRGSRSEMTGVRAYHQMEIAYGEFETGVQVRAPVEETGIEATYADGFLRVVLPKAHPTRISIDGPS